MVVCCFEDEGCVGSTLDLSNCFEVFDRLVRGVGGGRNYRGFLDLPEVSSKFGSLFSLNDFAQGWAAITTGCATLPYYRHSKMAWWLHLVVWIKDGSTA